MDTVICKELIVSTIKRRGTGVPHSPVRIITEVYEKDGTLIAERDPSPETFTPLDMVKFAEFCLRGKVSPDAITINTVNQWLDQIKTTP